jgi:hypothetical protein
LADVYRICYIYAVDIGGAVETSKIRIKFEGHEFEAEGPAESVQRQFEAFKEMVTSSTRQVSQPARPSIVQNKQSKDNPNGFPHVHLEKILHVSGRIVSLTAIPTSTEDAALLIILGHKDLRNNLTVTGQEIGDGLAQSGRPVPRVDRIMEKAIDDAFILKTGIKRATRYRLTNQGLNKALAIAQELINSVP